MRSHVHHTSSLHTVITNRLSLAQLTALPAEPPAFIQMAVDAGCAHCGIRLLPATPGGTAYPLMDNPALLRATEARLTDTGVRLFDLEIVRIGAVFDGPALHPFFEVGQRLGAKAVLVAGDDRDEARLTARYAALCELAAPYGLSCDLEFMPWTAVKDLATARRIVGRAAQPNAGILVDAIHFARSGSTLEQLRAVPRHWLHYAQLCDALVPAPTTTEGLIHDARCARLLPGEGGLDLPSLLAALPGDLPLSIEIPHDVRAPAMGYAAWTQAAANATRRLMDVGR